MDEVLLANDSFVDKAVASVGICLWNDRAGKITNAVQLLVRPIDIRSDESGDHPGESFVHLTITREEVKAMLQALDEDWREVSQATRKHEWKWHPVAGEGKICHQCGLRDYSED